MTTGMDEWAHGSAGRTVTWPDPDAYVLVEGVLLRMLPEPPGLAPGTEVTVRRDPVRGLVAYEAAHARAEAENGGENGARNDGGAAPV